jgi:hypothetical protein
LYQAILLKPDFAEAYNNLGIVLSQQGDLEKSQDYYREALRYQPRFPEPLINLGNVCCLQGQLPAAISYYQQALDLNPNHPDAHWNWAHILLMQGQLEQGFKEHEWRWKRNKPRPFPYPCWDGSPLQDQTILLWGEQGVGDEILFASLVPEVLTSSKGCWIECEARLVPLFSRSFPQAEVIARTNPVDPRLLEAPIQVQSSLGSVARWTRLQEEAFPAHQGYLQAAPEQVQTCRQRYRSLGNDLVVGISWYSSNKLKHLPPLADWQPILQVPGITFVNLQYGDRSAELASLRQQAGIEIYSDTTIDSLQSLDDFAAQVAAMDLVISISNTTVHMAGALGVPVWTVLSWIPETRWWMLDRQDNPWYPSMRLFRQAHPQHGYHAAAGTSTVSTRFMDQQESGDWTALIEQVAMALREWSPQHHPS